MKRAVRLTIYCLQIILICSCKIFSVVPAYLADQDKAFNLNPHGTNLEWFKNAGYGMFIHFGLYSRPDLFPIDSTYALVRSLSPHAWGYNKVYDGNHKTVDEIMQMLNDARAIDTNLLLNVGFKEILFQQYDFSETDWEKTIGCFQPKTLANRAFFLNAIRCFVRNTLQCFRTFRSNTLK